MKPLSERVGDRTHGATLMECEQWAEEVRLKDEYIAQLAAENEMLMKVIECGATMGATADYYLQEWLDALKGDDDEKRDRMKCPDPQSDGWRNR